METINARGELALVFERRGRTHDAHEMMRQVVAGLEQQLDPQHPWVVEFKDDLERMEANVAMVGE